MKCSVILHRSVLILVAITTAALMAVDAPSQGVIHTTTTVNTVASRSIIDIPLLNGNPTALIIATPLDTAASNPHPIGAWYYNARWSIFNVDHANMPIGLQFKVEYFIRSDSNHFLHVVTNGRGPAYIDNPSLNNNATAQVRIFQNHAPDFRTGRLNRYEATAEYDAAVGKWFIKNLNGLAVLPDTAYNVVVGPQTITTPKLAVHIPELTIKATVADPPPQPAASPPEATSSGTGRCTDGMARQTVGRWARQKPDDLAMADRTFPKTGYKSVLAKAQEVIELFKIANPQFKGIEAHAYRGIRGRSVIPNGPVPFRADVWYGSFICVGDDTYKVDMRGKIIVHGNYGYTVVTFNSLDDVLRSPRDGAPFLTTDGEEIREYSKDLGEFKGFPFIQTSHRDSYHEAIIIASNDRLPYKPVTREQYVRARMQDYQKNGFTGDAIVGFERVLENMSPSERQAPAIVRDVSTMPGGSRLFATEAEGGRHLVTIDKSYFNPKLPRDKIQLITVHWHSSPNDPSDQPKVEMLKSFKENFDFIALWEMLDNQK